MTARPTPAHKVAVALMRTACAHAVRRWPVTLVSIVIASLVAGSTTYLIGAAAERNADLVEALRAPEVRSITVRSDGNAGRGLDAFAAKSIAQLPGVERAVALSRVATGTIAPYRDREIAVGYFEVVTLAGQPPYDLIAGRSPLPGEAITSAAAARQLRLTEQSAGSILVDETIVPIVGTYTVADLGTLSDLLEPSVLTLGASEQHTYHSLVLLVREPSDVAVVVDAIGTLLAPLGLDSFTVDFDSRASDVQALVAASGNESARTTAVTLVSAGAIITAAIALLSALLQRRDNARRRALGYRRSHIMAITIFEALGVSTAGAIGGVTIAHVALAVDQAQLPAGQLIATVAFVACVGTVSAVPGGLAAAVQDPARILRVP